ncbi:MAG: LUD domain-containing protein [Candidatus Hydrogenedentes bacterium]|nr:LUD domain-containing protein [Candidatus Hydrogenedentota bacterium]
MTERYERLCAAVSKALETPERGTALQRCMQRGRDSRGRAIAVLPGGEAFRAEVKAIKDRCIERQDELVAKFTACAQARGAHVYFAENGAAAIDYVLQLARKRGAATIAKSKSLTTEEIEINDPLIEAGLRVIETDLGELIIQLVHERPYHLVFPAVHKLTAEVAAIFAKALDKEVSPDIPSIMKVVRAYLRPIFLDADIGMTGANIGVAENGSIVIETNEGNGRLVSTIGNCHVCVMGIEKIVDTIDEALTLVLAHPVSSSGQLPTTYVTWMAGRADMGDAGVPRETHIVLLDNGRKAMRQDPGLREALNCIRCGACMNICTTYGVVGGHTFGHIYPGPIGIPWTAAVHGLDKAAAFAPLCISCGLCKEICPAEIDLPMLIAEVKHRVAKRDGYHRADRTMMSAERFAQTGSTLAPFANRALQNRTARRIMAKTLGIDADRVLPAFSRKTFKQLFTGHTSSVENPLRKVALFIDVYANFNRPDIGMAAVECLEAAGCEVLLPEQHASGYPYIGYGDLDRAREAAAFNVARLAPLARTGCDIVAIEPTAAYCLRHAYPALLGHSRKSLEVAERSFEIFRYLLDHEPEFEHVGGKTDRSGRRYGFHVSCHQRPMGSGREAVEWLRHRGARVEVIETGTCCGMGGTFGLKAGPLGQGLSKAAGLGLCKKFKESGVEAIVSESSVCAIQLREGTGLPVLHPVELLLPAQG